MTKHGVKATITHLASDLLPLPAICLVKYSGFKRANVQDVNYLGWHWILVLTINSDTIICHDPDYWGTSINVGDHKVYSRAEFDAAYIPYGSASRRDNSVRYAIVWEELPQTMPSKLKITDSKGQYSLFDPPISTEIVDGLPVPAPHNPIFNAYPDIINSGWGTVLSWKATEGADGIYLDGQGVAGPSGSTPRYPSKTQTFTLKVTYPGEDPITLTRTVTVNQVTPPPPVIVKYQVGFNALNDGGAAREAYAAGCRVFAMMNDTDTANWLAQQPGTVVLYRQWWNHAPGEDELFNALSIPRLDYRVIRIGINECEFIDGNDFASHAALDINVARRLRAQDSRVRYAAGTFSMGTPDFTSQAVCDAVRQYYTPAFNDGTIDWDHHLYSPNTQWIYKGTGQALTANFKPMPLRGKVGKDNHEATWADNILSAGAARAIVALATFNDTPTYQDWFETRYNFLFTRCGFNRSSGSHIYSTEMGVDEGGVGGFSAHNATDQDVVNYFKRFVAIQSPPFVAGCVFQLGATQGRWDGYDMRKYVAALKAAGVWA